MQTASIAIPPITISYRNFSVTVDSLNLTPGEILGMFGKSGAGKTSYLKRVREQFNAPRAHYMSQFDSLLEEITVRQNIELALTCSGKSKQEIQNWEVDYADMLKEFEVSMFMAKYPTQLSGGQRKRVELVRFLMMDPEILLLDEPFVGIGHLFEAVATKYIIKRANSKRGGTIIVSHDFDLLCKFSQRVLLIDDQGIIGFVPVHDPAWKPEDVRTAWTLGVENVIPLALFRSFQQGQHAALPEEVAHPFVSFWGWKATWGVAEKDLAIGQMLLRIPHELLHATRTYLLHGTLYTEAIVVPQGEESIAMVGKGEIVRGADAALAIQDVSLLKDNVRA